LQRDSEKLSLCAGAIARWKILLAKHYDSVMIGLLRLITAASLKWMKWMAAARWSGLRLLFVLRTRHA